MLKDNQWLIFPDTIFSNMETVDCNNTMEGKCYEDKSFDECINMCEKSPKCNFGYYIHGAGSKNICVPLLDLGMHSNPMYRLRNKGIYPEMKDTHTKTFFDRSVFHFPPEQANNIFFMDNFNIQNVETSFWLDKYPSKTEQKDVLFNHEKEAEPLIMQLLQIPPNLSAGVQYVMVTYGENIAINIPTTTLIFRESKTNSEKLEWVARISNITDASAFQIIPTMAGKKIGDNVLFSDTFAIKTNASFLGVDKENNLVKLYYNTYNEAKERGHNVTFRFIPQIEGYYCNNAAQCTKISLKDMQVNEKGIGNIDGLAIGRNPGCWGVCKYKVPGQPYLKPLDTYETNSNSFHWVFVIIFLIMIISIIGFIIITRKNVN